MSSPRVKGLMLMLKVITGHGPQTDLVGFGVDTPIVLMHLKRKAVLWFCFVARRYCRYA